MKRKYYFLQLALLSAAISALGQGTFVYDQQSAVDPAYGEPGSMPIEPGAGQSFTPILPSVGFIRLFVYDAIVGGGPGGTIYVNLRADSITGSILSATASVMLPSRFIDQVDFFFSTPVAVTPGATYFFEPLFQSGSGLQTIAGIYNYPGGTMFYQNTAYPGSDYWFREGVVPEPGTWALLIFGVGWIAVRRRK
jgi:hypothetical protein